ncbi:hypothetical protein [Streptomyces venezuelae]|uniref:hypothetical protein n=1 Tax=Streptomyces venezuelae TaxID=54571 RepID=UPI003656708B
MQQVPLGGEDPKKSQTVWWALAAGYVAGSTSATTAVNAGMGTTAAVISASIQGVIGAAAWVYVQRKQR